MRRDWTRFARRLEGALSAEVRLALAVDPLPTVGTLGLSVRAVDFGTGSDDCSCDGAYFAAQQAVCYVPTPGSRRENFTVLHELGHHLVRADEDLLSQLADMDEDGGLTAEERICDALAGRLLINDESLSAALSGRRPRAADVQRLYDVTAGSMEACAVRLAERMGCDGYFALLDRRAQEVRFASPSPQSEYPWARRSRLPGDHPAWKAGADGSHQGEGDVVWPSGNRRRYWLDAVGAGNTIVAVFAETRYWPSSGLSILGEASVTRSTRQVFSGRCRHCGGPAYGTRACEVCGDARCRRCGRCGCGASEPAIKTCTRCHLSKGTAQFRRGVAVCRTCELDR